MSPNQGPEALLEGSNHNLSYQTDVLIVESSGSTRRIQRAQDRKILISLRHPNVHRTKSINRALITPRRGGGKGRRGKGRREEEEEKRREEGKEGRNSSSTTAGFSSDAETLPDFQVTPEFCTTPK
ncbi:hypothetical protein M5K25_024178 [Dendrobium thyrsiflorum]|uniref:Uncharacterized protein n=1 Tax=Dendrobium thyrsiflorum TaxID=117978 RepID=A0ABD0U1N9_DENTH